MKIIYFKILTLILLMSPTYIYAQQNMLRGKVKDKVDVMVGVNVILLDADKRVVTGVTTNINGEYFINIPQGIKEIEYSFIGYKAHRVEYTGQAVINVTLEEEIKSLDAFVITAQAVERNSLGIASKDLGVARQKIELDEYQDMPVTSVEDMLQGKLANVDIVAGSGDPGSRSSIRIRGTSSLNISNEPLIVIDDIPQETEISDDLDLNTATDEEIGSLLSISPNDIASIEVLKDAGATAIWGSKAANGVLLITTKRGSKGKPRFSVGQKLTYKREPDGIPMLNANQYIAMMQDALWNNVRDRDFTYGAANILTQYPDLRYDPNYKWFNEFNQDTDWLDLVTQDAFSSETTFSMDGGGERASYRFSTSYLTENGTTIGTDFKRITARLNVDYNLSAKLRAYATFAYTESNREGNYSGSERAHARNKMPNMSPWVIGEDGRPTNEYFTNPTENPPIQGTWASSGQYNPLAMVKDSKNNTTQRIMNINFSLRYDIVRGLQFLQNLSFDLQSSKVKKFLPSSATGVPWTHDDYNVGEDNTNDRITVYSNSRFIYSYTLNDFHKFTATGTIQLRDSEYNSQSSKVAGLGSSQVSDPTAGGRLLSIGSSKTQGREIGFLLNGHYKYGERYSLTAGIRRDGNSRIGKNERWGNFATVSLSWWLSEESFLLEKEWLNNLRLRASWGRSGLAPDNLYGYIGKFSDNGKFIDLPAAKPASMQLNNLKWEITNSYNGGIDFQVLNNKLSVAFDYYKDIRNNLLHSNASISSSTGYGTIAYLNSGSIENRGWEVAIDIKDIIKTRDFSFSITNLNLSRNRNRVKELPSNVSYDNYTFGNGNYAQNVVIGNPIGSFYGYKYLGVYQNLNQTLARDKDGNVIKNIEGEDVITVIGSEGTATTVKPGDAHYEDINKDGVIDKYDIVYLGNSSPIVIGGGSLFFTYKNFRLRGSFQTRIGQSVINRARINSENMRSANNQSTAVLRRWRYEGDQTEIPRALYGRGYNYLGSDRFVEKATFLRLKDIMLSYTFSKDLVQRWGLTKVSCYITAYDVYTWTNYKGQDPEVGFSSSKGIFQLAEDNSYTPRPFRLAFGFSIDF